MKSKKSISILAIYGIILAAFNIIYFFIPFPKTAAAWVCYGFSTLAVLVSCAIIFVAFMKDEPLKSKVYGYPIYRVGIIYLSAQFAFSILILCIGFAVEVPAWIPVVVSFVDLAYALIGLIVGENARDIIQQQEKELEQNTVQMTYFKIDISYIVDICKDAELKKTLSNLLNEFKYSDPVSNPQLKGVEETLKNEVNRLRELVNEDNAAAMEKAAEISRLLADRNRRCKAFKH